MKIQVLDERGFNIAIFGLGFSRGITSEMTFDEFNSIDLLGNKDTLQYSQMFDVAHKLASKDNGENKLLESIAVWLDIDAPRYWWAQFDTYRVGVTKQSESTMYGLTNKVLTNCDFEGYTGPLVLERLFYLQSVENLDQLKKELPQAFLQRRIVATNYKTIRHIYQQRHDHKLEQWHIFCSELLKQLLHPEFLR